MDAPSVDAPDADSPLGSDLGRDTVAEDVPDTPLPPVLTCSAELTACGADAGCAADCPRYCGRWSARRQDDSLYDGESVCFVGAMARCTGALVGSLVCPVGLVCTFTELDVPGGCVRADQCLAYRERFRAGAPAESTRPDCWYSDLTLPVDGHLPTANCMNVGIRTCGIGCDSCVPGTKCIWASERVPTGLCLPVEDQTGITGSRCAPMATSTTPPSVRCGPGDRCLRPQRGDLDGRTDRDRYGVCVGANDCTAVAQALPGAYVCDPAP